MCRAIVTCLVLGFASEVPEADKAARDRTLGWRQLYQRTAEEYAVSVARNVPVACAMVPNPVMRTLGPIRNEGKGAVYIWTHEGRPAVIGTFFYWRDEAGYLVVTHELHSLALEPLIVRWKDKADWTPNKAGIALQPIPNAPSPAEAAPARLRQMRHLARQFTAQSIDFRGGRWHPRLLSQPLHRYDAGADLGEWLDGALFAFVRETDPEIILAVEARRREGQYQWQYSAARFSDLELHLALDGTEVWRQRSRDYGHPTGPYYTINVERRTEPPTATEVHPGSHEAKEKRR